MSLGLYIHVPFCRTRCHFCAFSLQIHREDRVQRYLAALHREIAFHAEQNSLAGRPLDTVYFGGGTPTTLQSIQLTDILDRVRRTFGIHEQAEITVEAHPDTVSAESLEPLVIAGVTRISFGAQSMDDDELLQIGRRTSSDRTHQAVTSARKAGLTNINLDLIYGVPGQTPEGWMATLDEILALEPTHASCYALTVEEKTRLHLDVRRGDAAEPDSALQNDMEDAAAARLASAGFTRYEISNYANPGFACRHNLLYWQDGEYLGVGPSAQSYVGGNRFGNMDETVNYCEQLEIGRSPIVHLDRLSVTQRRREAMVFGLRLINGVDPTLTGTDASDREGQAALARLLDRGWLEREAGRIRLTEAGRRFADSVAVELL